jgi:predicted RNA-binding protein with PUA-like domain
MHYWLLKTEPNCWSWTDQVRDQVTSWDGVRNFQAQKHMRAMKKGDRAFFYHTGKERQIVGIVEVTREIYPDATDSSGKFGMVDVKTIAPFQKPVTLDHIKQDPRCAHLPLVTQGRLSVMPIDEACWDLISQWGQNS